MVANAALDRTTAARVDPSGMLDRINELPDQIDEAWSLTRDVRPPVRREDIRAIVVTGMGGSAIGGDLVRAMVLPVSPVPIIVSREYDLPTFADERTLVIASSYSGNTEETLSAYRQALERRCPTMAITTGGTLEKLAGEAGQTVLRFAYPQNQQPRAAVGYSFGLMYGVVERLGLVGDVEPEVVNATAILRSVRSDCALDMLEPANRAKTLARALHNRIPTVYGAGVMTEVAKRWKGQFNENSKAWAGWEPLPELNHNAVVGYTQPYNLPDQAHVILFDSTHYHARTSVRLKVTAELLERRGIPHTVLPPTGDSQLGQVLAALYVGDFVSYYLALLYGEDPTPVTSIDYLKNRLAGASS